MLIFCQYLMSNQWHLNQRRLKDFFHLFAKKKPDGLFNDIMDGL